eukprot:GGOE01026987.1.p8 GENE.GGOE01026987.1~~GGOE01026987.1.p8  ORF type:complete len:113 (-),score=0.46 GGOE01026987.1:518-856(-)
MDSWEWFGAVEEHAAAAEYKLDGVGICGEGTENDNGKDGGDWGDGGWTKKRAIGSLCIDEAVKCGRTKHKTQEADESVEPSHPNCWEHHSAPANHRSLGPAPPDKDRKSWRL